MPTYIRWREPGAMYFFTVVTYRRRGILTQPRTRRLLGAVIREVRANLPFDILAFVLLPDHLHCIWQLPSGDDDFPERWRRIKGGFTQRFLSCGGRDVAVTRDQCRQGRRGVWQPRYWEHRIRDDDDYTRHRDYIHLNPMTHGFVEDLRDWPWSSFHRHVQLGWLDPDWPGGSPVCLPEVVE